jgi:hypothetical protein
VRAQERQREDVGEVEMRDPAEEFGSELDGLPKCHTARTGAVQKQTVAAGVNKRNRRGGGRLRSFYAAHVHAGELETVEEFVSRRVVTDHAEQTHRHAEFAKSERRGGAITAEARVDFLDPCRRAPLEPVNRPDKRVVDDVACAENAAE